MTMPSAADPMPPPDGVLALAGGARVDGVWRNSLGGETFRLVDDGATRFLKWQEWSSLTPAERADVDLDAEAERLAWARSAVPVPRVLDAGSAGSARWLLTEGIAGLPAVHPRWLAEPEVAVRAIATGLRRLHDALDVAECPFVGSWPGDAPVPEPDLLVVCHGDPCVPNTIIADDGSFAGHVDLGRLGVADRWADLAIASDSISWPFNLGPGWDGLFFETYGIEPDPARIAAYRTLWHAE